MKLTAMTASYLEALQTGHTIKEMMAIFEKEEQAMYQTLYLLRIAGYVSMATEPATPTKGGQRGVYKTTDKGMAAMIEFATTDKLVSDFRANMVAAIIWLYGIEKTSLWITRALRVNKKMVDEVIEHHIYERDSQKRDVQDD